VFLKGDAVVKRTVFGDGNVLVDRAVFMWCLLLNILAEILSHVAVY